MTKQLFLQFTVSVCNPLRTLPLALRTLPPALLPPALLPPALLPPALLPPALLPLKAIFQKLKLKEEKDWEEGLPEDTTAEFTDRSGFLT